MFHTCNFSETWLSFLLHFCLFLLQALHFSEYEALNKVHLYEKQKKSGSLLPLFLSIYKPYFRLKESFPIMTPSAKMYTL